MDQIYADAPQRDRVREAPRTEHEIHDQPPAEPRRPSRWRRRLLLAGGFLVLLVLVGAGVAYWLATRDYQSTTDARIAGNVTQMASQVAGRVTAI